MNTMKNIPMLNSIENILKNMKNIGHKILSWKIYLRFSKIFGKNIIF